MTLVLALSAVAPALLLMWYFWARDAYPEPARVLWATFALGVVSVLPVALVGVPIDIALRSVANPWVGGLAEAFLVAAIPEEVVKFCILYYYCLRHSEFDEPMDGLVYGAAASMGFAAFENLIYIYSGGLEVAMTRAVTAVPSHAVTGAIMGYFLALYHFLPRHRGRYLGQALAVPILLHGLYDFPLLTIDRLGEDNPLTALLLIGPLAVLTLELGLAMALLKRVRAVQAVHPPGGAGHRVLHGYHGTGSPARRLGTWVRVLLGGLFAWVGVGITVAAVGDMAESVLGVFILVGPGVGAAGILLFRTGVGRLNRLSDS